MSRRALYWLAMTLVVLDVDAQALRDPTQVPWATPMAPAVAPGSVAAQPPIDAGHVAVLVRDGTPYLLWGTRLFGVGQRLGAARIERITESEIWLREAGNLRKVRVFQGVERRAATSLTAGKKP